MRKCIVLFLAIALVTTSVVVGSAGMALAKKPIKMGAILNLTGAVAYLGPLFRNGITTALEEADYKVGGRKIELIVEVRSHVGNKLSLTRDLWS
jgi:hypothetical protein